MGHTRGAVFGDALASLLDYAGYDVTREYYINDGGAQVDVLARSVYLRYLEALGQEVAFEDGTYPGDYLIPVGEALAREKGDVWVGQPEEVWLAELRDFATDAMMELIRADLAALGVTMDVFFSEKSLYGTGRIEAAIEDLRGKGLIYRGVLEPPKGKTPEDWEPREQTLFRSTAHGDDVDRPITKSDGGWTYFAPDIAYHYDKISRGFDALIDVFGADHGGYVKRMKAAVSALSGGQGAARHQADPAGKPLQERRAVQDVQARRQFRHAARRGRPGRPGRHPLRHADPQERRAARFRFRQGAGAEPREPGLLRAICPCAGDEPCCAGRRGRDRGGRCHAGCGPICRAWITRPSWPLARKLAEWPRLVEIAARTHEPHRVAFYLYELAGEFHALWNRGNEIPALRFLQEGDAATSQAKIALARAVSVVISAGLGILGVTPAQEMR